MVAVLGGNLENNHRKTTNRKQQLLNAAANTYLWVVATTGKQQTEPSHPLAKITASS